MIVADRKPFDEIMEMVRPLKKVLVLGCGSCVTVCVTGGERQAEMLASQLNLAARKDGLELAAEFDCITRQCDREFIEDLAKDPADYDAVLSIACGVGVNHLTDRNSAVPVLPATSMPGTAASLATPLVTDWRIASFTIWRYSGSTGTIPRTLFSNRCRTLPWLSCTSRSRCGLTTLPPLPMAETAVMICNGVADR